MLGPTEAEILKYCYEHHTRLVSINEITAILPVPSIITDYVKILVGRGFLEPLNSGKTKITEMGIFKVETLL